MNRNELNIGAFDFEAGGHLEHVKMVYHTSGCRSGKVVWICHALTANSDPEDWWPQMVGPGKVLDTEKYSIVCVNLLCSPYGSSGPASTNPETGKPYLLSFPKTTIRDSVKGFELIRKELGIEHIDLLIGSSAGGFQAIEWAAQKPELFGHLVFSATSPAVSPWLAAQTETQRMAIEADPSFREARDLSGGAAGLRCARAQALITYRCFRGYELTQSEPDPDFLFAGRAASYQRYQGQKLLSRGFDAYSYYYICDAVDSHNIGRGRGGVKAALQGITAPTTVINIDTDNIFPPEEGRQWTKYLPNARQVILSSDFGHDGFLLETQQFTNVLEPILCKF
ncbi:MAG: homoserine O-acetyltransferase [Bacteroidales bacterium]|nr:homoserine O-acetyltransferase [Bacteroidales bacterium]